MKRPDNSRVSLADFLRSIQFAPQPAPVPANYGSARFAHFYPQVRGTAQPGADDLHLIRSAN